MKSFGAVGTILAGAAIFASSVTAATASTIDPIVIKVSHRPHVDCIDKPNPIIHVGQTLLLQNKSDGIVRTCTRRLPEMVRADRSHSFIRGVAYQQDYNANASAASNADYTDPLADVDACNRDIPYLVKLRTNVIRTYAVDPTKDHSGCMNAFAAAGIYIISDLSTPSQSINRNTPSWTTDLYQRYTDLIADLSQYNNVIGFFAGNEVSNSINTTAASAFVKAAVRDSKYYIAQKVSRPMYVGYATYDGDIRSQLAEYFNCGPTTDSIDFWGYNVYSWCGDSSYTASGYDERTAFFRDYSVPTFFAEYGCINPSPRQFTEVQALYGSQMTGVWSGGIVYMYFQEKNNYGTFHGAPNLQRLI